VLSRSSDAHLNLGSRKGTLEQEDGTPTDPPACHTVVPTWRPGDTIPLGADRTLRVTAIRDDDADQPPALVVEDLTLSAARGRPSHRATP
jgi:hypothetical protein